MITRKEDNNCLTTCLTENDDWPNYRENFKLDKEPKGFSSD